MPRDRQAAKGKNIRRAASSCPPQKEEDRQCRTITGLAVGGARNCAALPVSLLRFSVALARVPDLLVCAKHLFVAARTMGCGRAAASGTTSGSVGLAIARKRSLTSHLNRGVDGVFEVVRVVGRGLVSIAEVHDLASCSVMFSSGSKHTAACRSSARLDIAEVAHAKA